MEFGKRPLEPKSKFKELNGMKAEAYLGKARTMFEEMDLRGDLENWTVWPHTAKPIDY
jgi:hypothetical protein